MFKGKILLAIDKKLYLCPVQDISKHGVTIVIEDEIKTILCEGMFLGGLPIRINSQVQGYLNLQLTKIYTQEDKNLAFGKPADQETSSLIWEIIYRNFSSHASRIQMDEKTIDISAIPKIPGRGAYTEEARQERLAFIREQTGAKLKQVAINSFDPKKLTSNIEAFIGSVEIPVGIAGPIKVNGQHARGLFYTPLATSEGALVASVNRGALVLTRSGGTTTHVVEQRMLRVPLFILAEMESAFFFAEWIRGHFEEIREQTKKHSNYAELKELYPQVIGKHVHVHFVYQTGDAAGQNMTTTCTWNACIWILNQMKYFEHIKINNFFIEGMLSNDKKVTYQAFIKGRGIRVIAEAFIPGDILEAVLKVTPQQVGSAFEAGVTGALQAGMIGLNINVANVIAAMFTALGQDIASVHESSVAQFHIERTSDGLYTSMMLPSLVIGTVGGGTNLSQQRECLEVLGCAGPGKAHKLAEIIVSYCLALDLSTLAAIVSGQFASAHERLGRNRPVDNLKLTDLNEQTFSQIMQKTMSDSNIKVINAVTLDEGKIGSSIITELTSSKTKKIAGHYPYRLRYETTGDKEHIADVMVKIKPTDVEVIHTLNSIGNLCDPRLASELRKIDGKVGFKGCHIRELAVFEQKDPRFTKHIPTIYGIYRNDEREAYVIIQEFLRNMILMDTADDVSGWKDKHIKCAIDGISQVHSIWYGREEELKQMDWIGHYPTAERMEQFSRLWELLGVNAHQEFPEWFSEKDIDDLQLLIQGIPIWWKRIEPMKKTLIHNDFNPRNIAFRKTEDGMVLCAYDWELATIHLPQHDLAELLVFVLNDKTTKEELKYYAEYHRKALEIAAGCSIDEKEWWVGFRCCVWDLVVNRLLMYMMAHTVKSYGFMERVFNTARRFVNIIDLRGKTNE
ncbi:MAG: phosphotransferase [Desulfobacterales bacterium]|nr:phosphotransferase [Desulfobacterales bacterium]MBF0395936.1 phosphotransferase [Desulfobacterales bacterium]